MKILWWPGTELNDSGTVFFQQLADSTMDRKDTEDRKDSFCVRIVCGFFSPSFSTTLSRKLIEAQEQERDRIAESFTMISTNVSQCCTRTRTTGKRPFRNSGPCPGTPKKTNEISNDVQALSHELHSSKLQYFGAVRGMKSWCKEFGERQGIQIEFKSPEVETSLPPEIGLCLFRVLQEALHNAAKHSGAKRIEVQLRSDSREISTRHQ